MKSIIKQDRNFRLSALTVGVAATLSAPIPVIAQELEEVIVTATRRATSTQDVPYNISAYGGDVIEKRQLLDLGDFVKNVPGLSHNDVGLREAGNNSTLVMRGLSAEPGGGAGEIPSLARPTVSTYVGETPVYYNLRLTDIDRVEVLRGPQGTLYGAGSLGGTLRIMPNKPDADDVAVRLNASVSSTEDADDPNYNYDAMVNVPLGEQFAMRLSGGYAREAGFVDAVGLRPRDEDGAFLLEDPNDFAGSGPVVSSGTREDSNDGNVKHARLGLLWNVNDDVEALFSYHIQETETDNRQGQTIGEDRTLDQSGTAPFESDLNMASLEVVADLGFATLTSATSALELTVESGQDNSQFYEEAFSYYYFYYPRISTFSEYEASDDSFVQELRLASNGDGPLSWIAGIFYLDQDLEFDTIQEMPGFEDWWAASGKADYWGVPVPITSPQDLVYTQDRETSFTETAVFGEITYDISDAWSVTVGGRFFEQELDHEDISTLPTCYIINEDAFGAGFYCGEAPFGGSSVRNKDKLNDQIFKFNTFYALNDDTNVYATWSQGFRNGGVNALPTQGFIDDSYLAYAGLGVFPDLNTFEADKVDNYEVGIKGVLADNTLRYSAAVFFIEWQDPQARITGYNSGIDGVGNSTSDAESKGLELEISGLIGEGLAYTFGYAYTDAEFVEDGGLYTDSIVGGAKLPGHSKNMLAASLVYSMQIDGNPLDIGTDVFYRSDYDNALPGNFNEYDIDSITIWNVNASYQVGSWTLGLFAKNLADENSVVSAANIRSASNYEVITRPRTVGLSLTYEM